VPAAKALSGAYEEGIGGMLTIIKASLLASALMLLESCTGYLTSYQTSCVEGHVCECVQYTTINRSWLDCRDYGRVKSRAYWFSRNGSARPIALAAHGTDQKAATAEP
jgi:hypothetical protein